MHVSRVTPSLQQEAAIDCSLQELRHGEESPDVATSLPSSALYMFILAYLVVPLSLHMPSVSILPEKPAFSIYCRVDLIEKGAEPEPGLVLQ